MAQPAYRYQFRDGVFVKTDLQGNLITNTTTTSTSIAAAAATAPGAASSSSHPGDPFTRNPFEALNDDHRIDGAIQALNASGPLNPNFQTSSYSDYSSSTSSEGSPAPDAQASPAPDVHPVPSEVIISPPNSQQRFEAEANQSPTKVGLTEEDLLKRDREAIHYTKSLLLEGDTLVYIKYPGNIRPVDHTGFELSDQPHRVHSQSLLATGSSVFAELLGPTKQFRILRRMKLVNRLPNGVKYVLDLTPPEEGDEAVNITAELSCSLGIRMWYTAEYRCKVSSNLVGGVDPIIPAQQKRLSTTAMDLDNMDEVFDGQSATRPIVSQDAPAHVQMAEAIKRSIDDFDARKPSTSEDREVLEYCPIRHRIGLSNLLQLVEGRDVRLDSAPKVWTLFVLAKNMECETLVRDLIVSWMIAAPNSLFIEILPEKSFEIGFGLKLAMITRVAFSILVSEEALSVVSRLGGTSLEADKTNQFGRRREDLNEDLQRPIEYASKAFVERISKMFKDLIDPRLPWLDQLPEFAKVRQFEQHILESKGYRKYNEALSFIHELGNLLRHFVRGRILHAVIQDLTKEEEDTANEHRKAEEYVKSKVDPLSFGCRYDLMSMDERIFTTFFWRKLRNTGFGATSFSNLILDNANADVRAFAHEHKVIKVTSSELYDSVNKILDAILEAILTANYEDGIVPGEAYPASTVQPKAAPSFQLNVNKDADPWDTNDWASKELEEYWDDNSAITKADSKTNIALPIRGKTPSSIFSGILPGVFDEEKYARGTASTKSLYEAQLSIPGPSSPDRPPSKDSKPLGGIPFAGGNGIGLGTSNFTPRPPMEYDIKAGTPFFSLSELLSQVNLYIRTVCLKMLDTSDSFIDISITDTILCLTQEEFKFLPLWAGGDDDDSGGVFDPNIPFATAGPSGPGPSFHTGQSDASSRTASEFGGGMSSVNTSLGVEDGFSDHYDRRRVIADDDMHSETFSEDSSLYDIKGKGVDRGDFLGYRAPPSVTASSVTAGNESDTHDFYDASSSVAASSETMDLDALSFDNTDTATEMGLDTDDTDGDSVMGIAGDDTIDDDDDIDEEEAFDFGDGDSDEDMVIV